MLTMNKFLSAWIFVQVLTTLYIVLCTSEKDDDEQEENAPKLSDTIAIFTDVVKNKNLQLWFLYMFACKAAIKINDNVSMVYLTSELGFDKEKFAIIKVISTPFAIATSILGGYFAKGNPF